jgi:hypothetical protein
VSLFATEKLPSPVAVDGIVSIDNYQRNLVVRRPENLSGYEKLSWRTAHAALVRAEQSGWSSAVPTLWAHGVGQTGIAFGLPGDNLTLLFHFPVGKREYGELVSQPGLMAIVTIDRSAGVFMGVRFLHGRKG